MKYLMIFLSLYFIILQSEILAQDKDIREDVVVINVEVPVRVMYKGKPVDNLKKSDFILFEDGKPIKINGFNIVRKKISSQSIELDSKRKQFYKPRLIALVFNLVNYNKHLEKGLEHVFERILKESDKLIVLANNKLLTFNSLKGKNDIYKTVKKTLKNEGLKARINLTRYLRTVESDLFRALNSNNRNPHYVFYDLLKSYLQTFRDYKRDFLSTDINRYYNFSKYLERIKIEKWVISFYQIELFPKLSKKMGSILESIKGYIENARISQDAEVVAFSRQLEKMIMDIFKEQNADISFDSDEISKLFYKVNTTFHSILIPARIELMSQDFEYKRISTSLENNLRAITKKTGGTLLTTTDLGNAIETISEKEDIVYMITYAPESDSHHGKLEIKLKDTNYKVFYDNNVRARYLTKYLKKKAKRNRIIEISNINFKGKKLSVKLKNYKQEKSKKGKNGKININITIKEKSKVIYNESKMLMPKKKKMELTINFDWIEKGQHDLIIDIKDILTGRTAFEYLKIDVK